MSKTPPSPVPKAHPEAASDTAGDAAIVSEPAGYLDMPAGRREAAKAHAAHLAMTLRRVAADLPLQADVDDFRRVLWAAGRAEPGS